jgi:hypothetical protein
MGWGTLRGATREGEASKVKERFWGGTRRKFSCSPAKSLLGEEPKKQRTAVPLDDGKTPNACLTQRISTLEYRLIREATALVMPSSRQLTALARTEQCASERCWASAGLRWLIAFYSRCELVQDYSIDAYRLGTLPVTLLNIAVKLQAVS